MCGEGDEPGKDHSGEGGADEIAECVFGSPESESEGEEDSEGGDEDGVLRGAFVIEAAQAGGGPSGAGEGEDHAGGDVDGGVGSGECGGEDDEVHDAGGVGNLHGAEGGDEGAFGDAGVVPGHDAEQDDDGADIHKGESEKCHPHGAGSFFGGARFAGGDGDHFDSAEAVDGEGQGDEWGPDAFGKESALRVVLRSDAAAGEQRGADDDEDDDGGEFDHGEPELDASVGADAAQVDGEQQSGENHNPKVGAHTGKPGCHVGGGGDHFGADGEGEAEPV